jgi:exonuclease III
MQQSRINLSTSNPSLLRRHGHDISTPKDDHTRVSFQNPRGLDAWPYPGLELVTSMAEYDIDIGCCAETNLKFTEEMEAAAMVTLQRQFGNGYVATSSSNFKSKSQYLPGGTALFTRGKSIARITAQGSDTIGRYSWITLTGTNQKAICFVTAYRVPQSKSFRSKSRHDTTAHRQQVTALSAQGIMDPDPKQQILKDLAMFIQKKISEDTEVILLMDSNESTSSTKSKLKQFLTNNQLLDVHEEHHNNLPGTTRSGSNARIDHIFCTPDILQYITRSGYLALHDAIISDHIMLWIDFDSTRYFGGPPPTRIIPPAREFSYDNEKYKQAFLRELATIHNHQRIPQRINKLALAFKIHGPMQDNISKYNGIDSEIERSIKAAVRKVSRKPYGYDRSPALSAEADKYMYWKSILATLQHNQTTGPH